MLESLLKNNLGVIPIRTKVMNKFILSISFTLLCVVIIFALSSDVASQAVGDLEKIDNAVSSAQITFRDILYAIAVTFAAWPVSSFVSYLARIITRFVNRKFDKEIPDVVFRVLKYVVMIGMFVWAVAILGVDIRWSSLAIILIVLILGLMARPLVENGAAGLLLRSRPSFGIGDEIKTNDHVGEVVEINARSTVIKTRDQRSIHIPNTDLLSVPLTVYTHYKSRRSDLEVEIDYDVDIDKSSKILIEAMKKAKGVRKNPAPAVRATGFGTSTYKLKLRWWHDSSLSGDGQSTDQVVRLIKKHLDQNGIEMPSTEIIVKTKK